MPLPALVVVVLEIVLGAVEVVLGMVEEVTIGSGDDAEGLEVATVEVDNVDTVVLDTGAGSSRTSMQYDFPTTKLSHSAPTEGFCLSCQYVVVLAFDVYGCVRTHREKSSTVKKLSCRNTRQSTAVVKSVHQLQYFVVFGS
jgi:hypothetical protein